MNQPAIVTLTPGGLVLAQRLMKSLGRGEIVTQTDLRVQLTELFQAGRPLVCIMALGIVVRILGPLAKSKETDPPVVVVDEVGRFVISVLGGHGAGANDLAREVAKAIGAVPVITTASDALGLPAVDLIGKSRGWKIEDSKHLTEVSAAVVRGERIAVYQDAGSPNWWQEFGDWPAAFERVPSLPQERWPGVLVISDRLLPSPLGGLAATRQGSAPLRVAAKPLRGEGRKSYSPIIIYRPPTLVLGVGCRRGVPRAEIESMFQNVCQRHGFSPLSLGVVATATLKANEPGLQEFALLHDVPLVSFALEELAGVNDLPTPSEVVRAKIGIPGVAEPAAMLAAGTRQLLVTKQVGERVTMALARREEA